MAIVFIAAASFLVWDRLAPNPIGLAPPTPPALDQIPISTFPDAEIRKVRLSLQDADPDVRWAAIQLLFNIHDPQIAPTLERLIVEDSDPGVRMKIVALYKGHEELARLGPMIRGLNDPDKDVRLASLQALGDIGDPSITTWVTALLRDIEPEVRVAALHTLGRFQEKRAAEFKELAERLRKDYEEAVRRTARRR